MKKRLLLFVLIGTLLCSCTQSQQKIDKEVSSGVVLIFNQGYYSLELDDGTTFYFSGYDQDNNTLKGVTMNKDSVQYTGWTGTGFFISKDGKIVTNKHVVSGDVSEKDARRELATTLKNTKKQLESLYQENGEAIQQIIQLIAQARQNGEDFSALQQKGEELVAENNMIKLIYDAFDDLDPKSAELKYNTVVLGVAYNNTFIDNYGDLASCTIRDTSFKEDLAIIQLNDKKTPEGKYIFEIPAKDMLQHYSFGEYLARMIGDDKNERLMMIGFNHGPVLAVTDEGVSSQHTDGSVSRVEDDKIMYTIPAMPGSSGSPVLNMRGQLVAINFAGWASTQSFNYGIKEQKLFKHLQQQ